MARILLGWELGGGNGHAVKLQAIARHLAAQGHEVVHAVQQIGAFAGEVWQAPLWPAQLVATSQAVRVTPATMASFPSLTGQAAVHDEARLLDIVNAALAALGRAPLPALPALFAADRQLAAVFAELDPYAAWRREPVVPPSTAAPVPLADGKGDELFAYMTGHHARPLAFWQGLALSGLKVRVYDPALTAADHALLRDAGMMVEERPVPTAEIVARSRVLLSHGGLGFTATALLAGLPHLIVPFDLEKRAIAAAIEGMGLGRVIALDGLAAEPLAASLRETFADQDLAARARSAALGYRARVTLDADALAATLIAELARA